MKTTVLKVRPQSPDIRKIRAAADFIKKGGLVAFPTETVYGLGANALNSGAILRLFEAKRRPLDNPPIVHVCDEETVTSLASNVPKIAVELMKRFWPGPLTLIFRRSDAVPSVTVAGLNTVAVRMPRHDVALSLIRESDCPIAAPSANLAGRPSPTSAKHVLDDLDGRIEAVLDAGSTCVGVESTVLDLTVDPPEVLRPGGTPFEALKHILNNVKLSPYAVAEKSLPLGETRSPGLKHKHYAPKADVIVVEGEIEAVVEEVKRLAEMYAKKGKVGILATDETADNYNAVVLKSLGSRSHPAEAARNLFRLLREFDDERVSVVIAEGISPEGLGLAVMNRLRKASGYRIVRAGLREKCL